MTRIAILLSLAVSLAAGAAAAQTPRAAPQSREELTLSYAPVVKRAAPAVVNVYASRVVQSRGSPFQDDPFFRRFFGGAPGMPRERVQNSLGSGVIVSPDGVVITNNHVIENATEVRIVLADRREFEADITLRDQRTDLAVLRIKGGRGGFPSVAFGDSDALEVGDLVLAIGNPFGVGQTVTSGIVSALARTQVGVTDYQFFIQTDAAINPGNSGGALVDMTGRLVGINTAIFSRSGGSMGIGFAIPSSMVRVVAESAASGGVLRRPWLGARPQSVTNEIAETLALARPGGVILTSVDARGPAERAGLRTGDVILAIDGQEVLDANAFGYRLATKRLGGTAALRVLRQGRELTVNLPVEPAPEDPPRDERRIRGRSPFAGLTVVNVSPAINEEFSIEAERGVAVAEVAEGSPASAVGFRKGDVLLGVNGTELGSTRELERLADRVERLWRFQIKRGDRVLESAVGG